MVVINHRVRGGQHQLIILTVVVMICGVRVGRLRILMLQILELPFPHKIFLVMYLICMLTTLG